MHGRLLSALLREQEEDHRQRDFLPSTRNFLGSARPSRLPSMESVAFEASDGCAGGHPLSHASRPPKSPMLLQQPSVLAPRSVSPNRNVPQEATTTRSPPLSRTPSTGSSGAGGLETGSAQARLSRTPPSFPESLGTPLTKADSRHKELVRFFQKVATKLDADPGASVQAVSRQLLDQVAGLPDFTAAHVPNALPLVSSLCLLQYSCHPLSSWSFESAVLVLDICQYSRLTAALAHLGPHILNRCVNACLSPMIDHILGSGGDVIKFAGDAIVAVWNTSRLAESVQHAVACAAWLQEHCGHSPVPGTDQTLKIHIGIACGPLQSEILYSHCPDYENLHFVAGPPLEEAHEAADLAKATQVCLTNQCAALCPHAEFVATGSPGILRLLRWTPHSRPMEQVLLYEKPCHLVSGFVPFSILRWLQQGRELRSMEANRMLTVLFVYCNAQADVGRWVAEVQAVLKRHQCVILQVIHDDKGIHMVAAFNVFQTFADSGDRSVAVARELRGCTIGVAHGMVFCGLTGNGQASRWDITGFACVRACRLMQQAWRMQQPALFDASVLSTLADRGVLEELPQPFALKGSSSPVTGFVPRPVNSPHRPAPVPTPPALQAASCPLHQDVLDRVLEHLNRPGNYTTCVVHGVRGSGKRWLCLRALSSRGFQVVEHTADRNEGPLAVLHSVAAWCLVHGKTLGELPSQVLEMLQQQQVHSAYREGVRMLQQVVVAGQHVALLVRHSQFLDDASLRFLAEVVRCAPPPGSTRGQYVQCLTHYPTAGLEIPETLFSQIPKVQYFPLGKLDASQTAQLAEHCLGHPASTELLAAIQARTAGHCESVAAMCKFMRGPQEPLALTEWSWPVMNPVITLKMFHLFDLLPFLQQRMLKVIASISAQPGITAFLPSVMEVTASLLDLDPSSTKEAVLELENLGLISLCPHRCTAHTGGEELNSALCFCPALKEAVLEALLPEERCHINSVAARVFDIWHPMDHPLQFLVRSRHHRIAGESVECRKDLHVALQLLNSGTFANAGTILADINKDLEAIGGLGRKQSFAGQRMLMAIEVPPEPLALSGLRQFQPPLALGPLGWQVHAIGQAVLALYTSQTSNRAEGDLEAKTSQLKELLQQYVPTLQRVTSTVGVDAHLPEAMVQSSAPRALRDLAATVELAQALYGHLQELSNLAQQCITWASNAPIADLDATDVALRHLQQREPQCCDVAMAVLAVELRPAPPGPEGEAFSSLLQQVKQKCVANANQRLLSASCIRILHVFRSCLAVRALLLSHNGQTFTKLRGV